MLLVRASGPPALPELTGVKGGGDSRNRRWPERPRRALDCVASVRWRTVSLGRHARDAREAVTSRLGIPGRGFRPAPGNASIDR